eukprot:CAMPEP_0170490666 /NCGR_PEP_ID=MMETSP0208-20121228/8791_1 /TAXON_ID=197538 /ORGANISM="Strombidium inclinatum, Strain S3" /LENGTH=75 /DNA_ID=CAMNT_0010766107 /DNA_START=402 /DNA_END=626 /DNA_ORIENTATION=+
MLINYLRNDFEEPTAGVEKKDKELLQNELEHWGIVKRRVALEKMPYKLRAELNTMLEADPKDTWPGLNEATYKRW